MLNLLQFFRLIRDYPRRGTRGGKQKLHGSLALAKIENAREPWLFVVRIHTGEGIARGPSGAVVLGEAHEFCKPILTITTKREFIAR
jgi:hypothetical protein